MTKKYSITHSASSTNLKAETPGTSRFSASFGGYEEKELPNFEPEPSTPISPPSETNFFGSDLIIGTEPSISGDSSRLDVFKPFKKIRKLRFGIVQLRNFATEILKNFNNSSIQLSIQVRIDSEEIFTSAAVPAASK